MKGLKPPYLVLGTHHAFMDFYVTPLALFPHRANYVSELEGFEAYGEWLYRQVGCLGTRKFISDVDLVKNIQRVMKRKGILVLYPEARYANVGTSSELPTSVGKLIKLLKVPVVVINMQGNYLQSPIWNLAKRKGVKLNTTISQVLTPEQIQEMSVPDINNVVAENLQYDEYKYQADNHIRIFAFKSFKNLRIFFKCCRIQGVRAYQTDFYSVNFRDFIFAPSKSNNIILRQDLLSIFQSIHTIISCMVICNICSFNRAGC